MKKLLILLLILCLSVAPVFADEVVDTEDITEVAEETTDTPEENGYRIVELYAFTGKLYYCDTPTDRVVIRSIVSANSNSKENKMAKEAEYLEISLSPDAIWMANGTKTEVSYLNSYVDSDVWFIIARTYDGNLTIPYFSFK